MAEPCGYPLQLLLSDGYIRRRARGGRGKADRSRMQQAPSGHRGRKYADGLSGFPVVGLYLQEMPLLQFLSE